eukprot:scaffold99033_cov31-Tisochrysis_lutea.AAC.2
MVWMHLGYRGWWASWMCKNRCMRSAEDPPRVSQIWWHRQHPLRRGLRMRLRIGAARGIHRWWCCAGCWPKVSDRLHLRRYPCKGPKAWLDHEYWLHRMRVHQQLRTSPYKAASFQDSTIGAHPEQ